MSFGVELISCCKRALDFQDRFCAAISCALVSHNAPVLHGVG